MLVPVYQTKRRHLLVFINEVLTTEITSNMEHKTVPTA